MSENLKDIEYCVCRVSVARISGQIKKKNPIHALQSSALSWDKSHLHNGTLGKHSLCM